VIIGIVIDLQEDFVNGPLGTPEAKAIIPYVKNELSSRHYDLIVGTGDEHEDNKYYRGTIEGKRIPLHCVRGSGGSLLVDEANILPYNIPLHLFYKRTFGSLALPDILMDEAYGYGEDITEIHMMGVCTDICVISNALILRSAFPSVPIYVHANGCAGTTPENHEAALKVMRSCLIDVI
jgi:nicotinamidase-related amidase